jgi:hypothetical protein
MSLLRGVQRQSIPVTFRRVSEVLESLTDLLENHVFLEKNESKPPISNVRDDSPVYAGIDHNTLSAAVHEVDDDLRFKPVACTLP